LNSCYMCTPNTWYLIKYICNLTEYHYTYVFVPYKKHVHTNTSSMKPFSKTCHTSSFCVCSCFVFFVSMPTRLQPQDLFLIPWDCILTSLTLALPWWSFNHGLNVLRSWLCHASAPTLSILRVHVITLMQFI
jgi:hypothetical protein